MCQAIHARDRRLLVLLAPEPAGERNPVFVQIGSGRTQRGLYQLLNSTGYMEGWTIDNRYRGDDAFDVEMAERYRDHARRTCRAANLGA